MELNVFKAKPKRNDDQGPYSTLLFGMVCSFLLPFSFYLILKKDIFLPDLAFRLIEYYSEMHRYPEFILCGMAILTAYSKNKDIRRSMILTCISGTAVILIIKTAFIHEMPSAKALITSLVISSICILLSIPVQKADQREAVRSSRISSPVVTTLFWCALTAYILPFITDYSIAAHKYDLYSFYDVSSQYTGRYLLESLFYFLFLLFLIIMTGSAVTGFIILMIPYALLTISDSVMYNSRASFLHARDLIIFEAYGPAFRSFNSGAIPAIIFIVILFVLFYILFTVFLFRKTKKPLFLTGNFKYFKPVSAVAFILISICIFNLSSYLEIRSLFASEYDRSANTRFLLSRFFENTDKSTDIPDIDEALAYFRSNNQKTDGISEGSECLTPNIIVIMNESWWNTDNIDPEKSSVTLSFDPMKPAKEMVDDHCVMGYVNVNSYGGGTLHSEIEFLTGLNSKYMGPGDDLYEPLKNAVHPSITQYFNALGYNTTAMHPGDEAFYGRLNEYRKMGFDHIIFEDEFRERDKYFSFISDYSVMKEVIREFEDNNEASDSPSFIWAVTIANHSHILVPIAEEDIPDIFDIEVSFKNDNLSAGEKEMVRDYINGIYLSAKAFEYLTGYFENVNEPTIIIMYGDHCPQFNEKILKELGIERDEQTKNLERLYSTPVMIWSNYCTLSYKPDGENVSLMMANVLKECGLPDSEMTRIIRSVGDVFKADTKYIMLDNCGHQITRYSDEQLKTILNLHSIQYAFTNSDPSAADLWLPIEQMKTPSP